jgi:hypothetical protein
MKTAFQASLGVLRHDSTCRSMSKLVLEEFYGFYVPYGAKVNDIATLSARKTHLVSLARKERGSLGHR